MYEIFDDIYNAITREEQIKAGSRQKKIDLINTINLSSLSPLGRG
jgi:putative endonuclease